MADSGKVNIHGKEYKTVALRVNEFRGEHPEHTIETDIQSNSDLVVVKAFIKDGDKLLATGYAEEIRDSTNINKTSALENCETSAVGRALAFFGYGGSEIASANEVSGAIIAGAKKEVSDYIVKYMACLKDNLNAVLSVQSAVIEAKSPTDLSCLMADAVRNWYDMSEDEQKMLFGLPPSKGGFLSTKEREFIKINFARMQRELLGDGK